MQMIEIAAKAIYEKRNGAGCKPWSWQTASYRAPYIEDAIAAIGALGNPTESMIKSGQLAHQLAAGFGESWETQIGDIWRGMLATVLKESKQSSDLPQRFAREQMDELSGILSECNEMLRESEETK